MSEVQPSRAASRSAGGIGGVATCTSDRWGWRGGALSPLTPQECRYIYFGYRCFSNIGKKKKKEPHQYLTVKIPLRPTRGSSVLCNKRGATKASKPKAVLLACMSTPHVRRVGPAGNGSSLSLSLSLSLSPLHCMFPDRQKQNVVAVPARI